jgi:hypothetical protein
LYLGIASAPGELGPLITDPIPWRTPEQVVFFFVFCFVFFVLRITDVIPWRTPEQV